MNERIKELYSEAALYAFDQRFIPGVVRELQEVITERFAELIVAECAELIDNKVTITAAQTYDEVFVAVYDTNFANAKKIKEHFGVKE